MSRRNWRNESPTRAGGDGEGHTQLKLQIRQFDPQTEEWEYYRQYFELEVKSAGVEDEEKRKMALLTKIGSQVFKMLVDHFRPRRVSDCQYAELMEVLDNFYCDVRSIMTDRVQFSLRKRGDNEKVKHFISDLKALAGRCAFGSSLAERVRDQIIVGINKSSWQYDLLKTFPGNAHTLKEVETLALKLEQSLEAQLQLVKMTAEKHPNRLCTVSKHERRGRKPLVLVVGQNCMACGRNKHAAKEECRALGKECFVCRQKGHLALVCVTKGRAVIKSTNKRDAKGLRCANRLQETQSDGSASESDSVGESGLSCRQVSKHGSKVMLNVLMNQKPLRMLFDSGACQSVISKKTWKYIGRPQLEPYPNLRAYTDLEVETLGVGYVSVEAFDSTMDLPVIVVNKHDTPLFGLNWALKFNLPLPPGAEICTLTQATKEGGQPERRENEQIPVEIKKLLLKYPRLVDTNTGTVIGHKMEVKMKPGAEPKFFRPRPVPFALKAAVEQELERLLAEGIIEQIDPAVTPIDWASPLVIAPKPNGKIRLCADFKVTINKHIVTDMHPLPTFEEVCAELAGGEQFSVIDLRDAYLQMEVEENSKKYLVITTHKGFFRYRRMPFGIASAPAKFQRTMDVILQGVPGVKCYLDDIMVTAMDRSTHVKTIEAVLGRLNRAGMRLRLEKCKWLQDSVVFLGHRFDKNGIHPTEERIKAMKHLHVPTNVKELRAFLGCINYYQRFIPNIQGDCAVLHELLKKGVKWVWTEERQQKVDELKNVLTSADTLIH